MQHAVKEEDESPEKKPEVQRKTKPELAQLTPLMTQNVPAGMMQMHPQMYPGAYQLPPGYPSAPVTPHGMLPGSAPPPTVMYPHAPPTPAMMAAYQQHGYASGSSTPVHSNARSPARSRKTAGVENAAAWLGQQHAHLGGPGTPGPGSRAQSVMSYAGMSTMTGMNDDAISVMSTGTNFVELQPAASHQMENVDPSTMNATVEEARNWANRLVQAPEAASNLANLLRMRGVGQFPKEALEMLIYKTLEALCNVQRMQLDQAKGHEVLGHLFSILYMIAGISSQVRASIVGLAQAVGAFQQVMDITTYALQIGRIWTRALAFLNLLVRDEKSDHQRAVMSKIGTNKELFSVVFTQMINTHVSSAIEFLVRILRMGDRRGSRAKVTEQKVQLLLGGMERHEGLLSRCMRKNQHTQIHNTLKLVELLVRNDDPPQQPHEEAVQKWFIENNIFDFLEKCLATSSPALICQSLIIYANLASCPHIREDMASRIVQIMLSPCCLQQTELRLQSAIIHIIYNFSLKRIELQKSLAGTQTLNYVCHLIKSYANRVQVGCASNHSMLETALDLCHRQLQLTLPPELATQLWTEGGEHAHFSTLFFDASFVACLLNILVSASMGDRLKTRAVQVMVAGLALPANRFGPILFSSFAETNGENLVAALFNAISTAMTVAGTPTPASALFIKAAADLLLIIVQDNDLNFRLKALARSNTSHFPLNIVFCPTLENDEVLLKKLLLVCKELVEDPDLQQTWSQYRDRFNNLSLGNYEIATIVNDILGKIGMEGDNDYSMMTTIAQAFRLD